MMSEKSLDLSLSTYFSDECDSAVAMEIEENISDVIADLKEIQNELKRDLIKNYYDQNTKFCKMNKIKVRLELVDNKLLEINDMIKPNPLKHDDLVSNFGMSLKVENAKSKLNEMTKKHESLRKEWYSQEEHLNRLANEVDSKDNELQLRSIFCTTQGLILSKMLWKSSNFNNLLDLIISNSKLALELVKTLDGCLYAFTQTYYDEMPEPSAEEYQYVLCLCGILGNLASVPDGRFLLTSQPVCRDVFDQMIKILPNILVPKAEDLKWIMLTAIHNLMICKEGEEYAKNNRYLLKSLSECISDQHSNRIIILALKIMSCLTNKIINKSYMKHISSHLPVQRLHELRNSKDSVIVRKQAKSILLKIAINEYMNPVSILSSGMHSSRYYNNMEREELIHTTRLDNHRSRCKIVGTQTCSNKRTPEVLAYYVITDQSAANTTSTSESSASSTDSSPRKLSTDESYCQTSTESSSSGQSSKNSKNVDISHSFPISKRGVRRAPHSAPVSSNRRHSSRSQSPVYSSIQFADKNSSTFLAQNEVKHTKSVETSYPVDKQFNSKAASTLCCSSTMSMPGKVANLHQQLEEPTPSTSEEIQTVQCQIPQLNLNKFFSITIGDNLQNTNRNNVATTYVDKENAASIVTVFRISQSKALVTSDNSFSPFCSTISTNTSFPWEAMNNFFKYAANRRSAVVETSTNKKTDNNNDAFDVAYGGYGSYYAKLKCTDNQQSNHQLSMAEQEATPQFEFFEELNMPSTSTGYYGYQEAFNKFLGLPSRNVSSSSSVSESKHTSHTKLTKETQSGRVGRKSKTSTKRKNSSKAALGTKVECSAKESVHKKKGKKSKKVAIYRIFRKGRKRQ